MNIPKEHEPPFPWYEGMEPVRDCQCSACLYAVSLGSPYRKGSWTPQKAKPMADVNQASKDDGMMQPCRKGCGALVHLENDGFHVCDGTRASPPRIGDLVMVVKWWREGDTLPPGWDFLQAFNRERVAKCPDCGRRQDEPT